MAATHARRRGFHRDLRARLSRCVPQQVDRSALDVSAVPSLRPRRGGTNVAKRGEELATVNLMNRERNQEEDRRNRGPCHLIINDYWQG